MLVKPIYARALLATVEAIFTWVRSGGTTPRHPDVGPVQPGRRRGVEVDGHAFRAASRKPASRAGRAKLRRATLAMPFAVRAPARRTTYTPIPLHVWLS